MGFPPISRPGPFAGTFCGTSMSWQMWPVVLCPFWWLAPGLTVAAAHRWLPNVGVQPWPFSWAPDSEIQRLASYLQLDLLRRLELNRVKPELLTSHPFFSCSCLALPHLSEWVHCPPDCSGPKPRWCCCLFSLLAPLPPGTPSRVLLASPSRTLQPQPDCLYSLCCFLLYHHHLSLGLLQQPPAALWMPRMDSLYSGQRVF